MLESTWSAMSQLFASRASESDWPLAKPASRLVIWMEIELDPRVVEMQLKTSSEREKITALVNKIVIINMCLREESPHIFSPIGLSIDCVMRSEMLQNLNTEPVRNVIYSLYTWHEHAATGS